MSDLSSNQLVPRSHVIRVHDGVLTEIPATRWEQIVAGAYPLQPASAIVQLLLIRGGIPNPPECEPSGAAPVCSAVYTLQLQTDECGYPLTWHTGTPAAIQPAALAPAQSTTNSEEESGRESGKEPQRGSSAGSYVDSSAGQPANSRAPQLRVIDARARFLRRHLIHRHSWQPTPDVLAEALQLAGYCSWKTPETR